LNLYFWEARRNESENERILTVCSWGDIHNSWFVGGAVPHASGGFVFSRFASVRNYGHLAGPSATEVAA
jgi:hypothetical protein